MYPEDHQKRALFHKVYGSKGHGSGGARSNVRENRSQILVRSPTLAPTRCAVARFTHVAPIYTRRCVEPRFIQSFESFFHSRPDTLRSAARAPVPGGS